MAIDDHLGDERIERLSYSLLIRLRLPGNKGLALAVGPHTGTVRAHNGGPKQRCGEGCYVTKTTAAYRCYTVTPGGSVGAGYGCMHGRENQNGQPGQKCHDMHALSRELSKYVEFNTNKIQG